MKNLGRTLNIEIEKAVLFLLWNQYFREHEAGDTRSFEQWLEKNGLLIMPEEPRKHPVEELWEKHGLL